ncbi:MAG: WbqC family protein [Alphaproteobacteria bacterium]|nr:WbqC family protein [Alphaproteobacteria bacterium]
MSKKVAILQSNYIPWKGYFDIIRQVDEFIFYDDVKYTKNDWRNRNRIMTMQGARWLTIPCGEPTHQRIEEVRIDKNPWQKQHFELLAWNYKKAPFWSALEPFLKETYLDRTWEYLSDFNQSFITRVTRDYLGCDTAFAQSSAFTLKGAKEDRLLDLLEQAGATHYLSGPAARDYLKAESFAERGIQLEYMDYSGYPEYPQLHGSFDHAVSILDLLLNTGGDALRYMKPCGRSGAA